MPRLIDADALKEKSMIIELDGFDISVVAIGYINGAPTVDTEKRGEWRKFDGIFKCLACEKSYPYKCDYCPNCGAKMEGK